MLRAGAMFSLPSTDDDLSALEHGHTGDMAMSSGTATHSALSWSGHGEGHLFGAGFNVTLIVSLSLVTIHHTKCPHPLVPRSGANSETQSLFLPLQSLAWSLAWSLAGGIGSWLPAPGNGVRNGIVPVGCACASAAAPAPACRSRGFGGQGELGEWISCRAQTCSVSPVAQDRAGLFPILWDEVKVQLSAVCYGCGSALGMALSLLTWEPRAAAPRSKEHFVAVGTLYLKYFSLQQPWCHILGKAQLHMQGALNPRPVPQAPAFPQVLPSSPTPLPGCLFLQLPGCESLLSPVSVAAFEGIYKPRPSPCACLSRRRMQRSGSLLPSPPRRILV